MIGKSPASVRIVVVMACFNRRETTLRCLRSLLPQQTDYLRLDVYLVDDASADGTGDAVRAAFPLVHVLTGTGNLFWGGGMHMAMSEAIKQTYDFMLWVNDDVVLRPNAVADLLASYRRAVYESGRPAQIVIGAMSDPDTGAITYSGFNRRNCWHPAQVTRQDPVAGRLTQCDTLNGNCVLVHATVVEKIGIIDKNFIHQIGDFDYGYRAGRAGIPIWLAPEPLGTCPRNPPGDPWQRPGLTLRQKLMVLLSPRGLPPGPWLRFYTRYAGPLAPLLLGVAYSKALLSRPSGGRANHVS